MARWLNGMAITSPTYVIGNGPNGLAYYRQIPRDVTTIALNGAALHRPWSARFFGDTNCYRYDYFYDEKPGELRIGPYSCGDDFDIYVDMDLLTFGATVVGTCLNWLHHCGCNHVILVGVDMYGHHADGSDSGQSGVWRQLPKLTRVIERLSSSGMTIESLSPTHLDVEVIGNAQGLPENPSIAGRAK